LSITIAESREELEQRLQHETDARQQERLQMLYWLKRGLVSSRQQISQLLNRHEATVTRWLNDYRSGGLSQLLEIQSAAGAPRVIPVDVMERLQERLAEPSGSPSYKAIWQWLQQDCQVEVDYKTVYRIVRYELKAKLKVPRPRHHKQAAEAVEQFKETCPSP
jgi:transposase